MGQAFGITGISCYVAMVVLSQYKFFKTIHIPLQNVNITTVYKLYLNEKAQKAPTNNVLHIYSKGY